MLVTNEDERNKRLRQLGLLPEQKIDKLLSIYHERFTDGDYAGARKIEFVLSKEFGVEGDRSYDASPTNGDFEG